VHLCDRVLVLYGGRIVEEIGATASTENEIIQAALGGDAKRIAT
jgi:ABC-type sugar transport system ATPase subunit